MASLFEALMLVCFGFSWPMNVIKAYKARTAKGTSLAFIFLIITGYVAGITAKFMNHQINYVLAVYFLNLIIVSANIFVYIRNRRLDRRNEPMAKMTKNDYVVLMGGTTDSSIPVAEIAQDYDFNFKMFNRSAFGLSLANAKDEYIKKVESMNPESVILHVGQEDMTMFNSNSADFDVKYLELISYIRRNDSKKRIALVSNLDPTGKVNFAEMNRHIKAIADSEKCTFINIDNAKLWNPESTKELMAFMYDVGFDQPLNVKKPLADIAEIIYSYAYKTGILHYVESQAV